MKRLNVFLILAVALVALGLFAACEEPAVAVKKVTVTFVDPLGQLTAGPVTLDQGETLGEQFPFGPTDPVTVGGVANYFNGWFDGATEYDDETPVGASIELRARWSQLPPPPGYYITVSFEFTDDGGTGTGTAVVPTAAVNPVKVIKGRKLSKSQLPATPRSKGWKFDAWYDGASPYDFTTELNADKTLSATWIVAETWSITFNSSTGGSPVTPNPINVYQDECVDEWEVAFPQKPTNSDPRAFFVAWLDDENKEYDGRTVITRDLTLTARWGMPAYPVNFDTDVLSVDSSTDAAYGNVDYAAKVRGAWDNPAKKVIVNEVTYDSPYNTNRWRILYRVNMKFPSNFNVNYYTRYTIRARFYANKQGGPKPPDSSAFTPNKPAKGVGYNADGWLTSKDYKAAKDPNPSKSEDGWGQISWTSVANWDGQGASEETMLQRYNLDRKGGTINDTWAPLRGKDRLYPPFLLVQTSDNYIGHIEITDIIFHNGEKKYTMYEDEEGYDEAEE